jgi:TPP-dependent indolepyruvate ferredoxin oxidoreductase alpha subunit
MKNSNDNLKEKATKQGEAMNKNELKSVSGGSEEQWWGHYKVNWDICRGGATDHLGNWSCRRDCMNIEGCTALSWDYSPENYKPLITILLCHNCGACVKICPLNAIYSLI